MESKVIAQRIEKERPSPSLHLDSPILARVEQLLPKSVGGLRAVWMPKIPEALLNPPSAEYFERTRAETFGCSLAQLAKEKGGEEAWIETLPAFHELGKVIKANGGPFVMGETRE
jgi:hypothetical protein